MLQRAAVTPKLSEAGYDPPNMNPPFYVMLVILVFINLIITIGVFYGIKMKVM